MNRYRKFQRDLRQMAYRGHKNGALTDREGEQVLAAVEAIPQPHLRQWSSMRAGSQRNAMMREYLESSNHPGCKLILKHQLYQLVRSINKI